MAFKSSSLTVVGYLLEVNISVEDDVFIFHSDILSPLDKIAI